VQTCRCGKSVTELLILYESGNQTVQIPGTPLAVTCVPGRPVTSGSSAYGGVQAAYHIWGASKAALYLMEFLELIQVQWVDPMPALQYQAPHSVMCADNFDRV
jgi:hypothetical protein